MVGILDDLKDWDYFNIITFDDKVYHWEPVATSKGAYAHRATAEMKKEAINYTLGMNVFHT